MVIFVNVIMLRPENVLEASRDTPYPLEPIGSEEYRDVHFICKLSAN